MLNNPLRFIDDSGKMPIDIAGGSGGGAGMAVVMLISGLAQAAGQQASALTVRLAPAANATMQTWSLAGNQIIAAGDQLSRAVQDAGQAGNTAGSSGSPNNWDPNRFKFKSNSSLRSHFKDHALDAVDEAWEDVLGVTRSQLEAARSDPGQLAKLQDAYVQVGQQTSRASNFIGVQAQGQQVFVDTSNKVVSIVQGERFLSIFRIDRWNQFVATMEAQGLELAPGVTLEALRKAMGY